MFRDDIEAINRLRYLRREAEHLRLVRLAQDSAKASGSLSFLAWFWQWRRVFNPLRRARHIALLNRQNDLPGSHPASG